jgi:hypothetical protein
VIQEFEDGISRLPRAHYHFFGFSDEITQQWLPLISISWMQENGNREVHFLTNSQALCRNFRGAEKWTWRGKRVD